VSKPAIDLSDDYTNELMCKIVERLMEHMSTETKYWFAEQVDQSMSDISDHSDPKDMLRDLTFYGIWDIINKVCMEE